MRFELICALSLLAACKAPGAAPPDLAAPPDMVVAENMVDLMAPPGSDLLGADLKNPADLAGADLKLATAIPISLVDVNPNSVPLGQTKGTTTFAGKAIAVLFLEAS